MRTCLAVCGGALLLFPAAALADYGPKGAVYGGKAKGGTGPSPNRVHPISASLSDNGKQIKTLRVTVNAPCTSGAIPSPEFWFDVKIARNGDFSDSDTFVQQTSDGGTITWKSQLQGHLTARGGEGKSRDVATIKDSSGTVVNECDTGVVRFDLDRGRGVFGGVVPLPSFGDAPYPVSVERNRERTKLTSFRIRYLAGCGEGVSPHANSFEHFNVALTQRGKFSVSRDFTYKGTNGNTYTGTVKLAGRLRRKSGSGTYRATFTSVTTDGTQFNCDTGRLEWSVKRG